MSETGDKQLKLWFDHGLGDCVHFLAMLQPYIRRGWDVSVHFEENKRWLWEALRVPYCGLDGAQYHPYTYLDSFNGPTHIEGTGNKMAGNFVHPLPDLGVPPEQLWAEVCQHDMSQAMYWHIDPAVQAKVDAFLVGTVEPLILLHTHGTNWPESKTIPDATVSELYDRLLSNMPGTVICLDWNNRVPVLRDGRMRHMLHHYGHMTVEELAALYRRAALLIGIDSGPYHLAHFTDLPALGVFHHHYPGCVTLPRTRSAVMTRNAPDYQACNRPRRALWSILEYPGVYPPAEDIARHALRMLAGPRYLTQDRIGRDVMLQQIVRDWLRSRTPSHDRAYRDGTVDYVLRALSSSSRTHFRIVETGCQRSVDDWGAGGSTTTFAAFLDGWGAGELDSVDISPENLAIARQVVDSQKWGDRVHLHLMDSRQYLQERTEEIDLLYLDSLDADQPGHAEHCLEEFRAAERLLHKDSILMVDDCFFDTSWNGKGRLTVPFALANGWKVVASGYQVVLARR